MVEARRFERERSRNMVRLNLRASTWENASVRKLQIDHLTEYRFETETTLLPHRLLLRPRENPFMPPDSTSSSAIHPSARVRTIATF